MFEKLIGIAAGSFGRSLLLAGFVPALVVVLLSAAYFVPAKTLAGYTGKLLKQEKTSTEKGDKTANRSPPAELPAELILGVVLMAVLSGLLFAGRSAVLRYVEIVPFPVRLQRRLRARQEGRRNRALKDKQEAEFLRTCIYWILNKPDQLPKFCPDEDSIPPEGELRARSETARVALGRPSPREEDFLVVRDGAQALYLLGYKYAAGAFDGERKHWKELLGKRSAIGFLTTIDMDLNRRWVAAYFLFNQFPSSQWLRPTTLGNKIEAVEEYGQSRYGIETSTLLNRVWWVLPDGDKESVGAAKLAVESLVNLSLSFALAGIVIAAAALRQSFGAYGAEDIVINWRALLFIATCVAFCWMCYLAATAAVDGLRERIVGLVDMYRLRAMVRLGFGPKTFDAELAIHRELQGFLVQARPLATAKAHYIPWKPDEET